LVHGARIHQLAGKGEDSGSPDSHQVPRSDHGRVLRYVGRHFSATDCLLLAVRQEDSPLNSVAAGFVTGAILSNRNGAAAAWRSGMVGGLILGIIEGVNYVYTVTMLKQQARMMQVMSTLQDERIRRQSTGQADFTPDELNNMMGAAMRGEELAFKKPVVSPR